MITFIITIYFLQSICSMTSSTTDLTNNNNRYNSLISAQCKARCLYEYRNHHHQQQRSVSNTFNNGKNKRLLTTNALTLPWRSIWERCPRLITCSSCLLPCDLDPPLLLSNEESCQAICSTFRTDECQRSCIFIQKLYQQQSNCLTDDCQSSSCSPLNDCFEHIPQPKDVIPIERKSRRTVRLKWNADQKNNIEPIFYVIEAQWTLPKTENNQEEIVSKWGFVKEEVSHTKAIIRNIQRDNRWYRFRVAAVTRHGYSPFSITTQPFRLSSNSKNESRKFLSKIPQPKNFLVKDYQINSNLINITLSWQSPDMPVNGYQISWQIQNDPSSTVNTIDISSFIHPLELTIPYLSIHSSYLFKIRSLIISENTIVQTSHPISLEFNYENELFSIKNFQLSKPYFINGQIKTNISWNKIIDYRFQQYDIHWMETQCYSDVPSCCYRRDAITTDHFYELNDLRFNCTYILSIKPILTKIRTKKSFQYYFNVSSCQTIEIIGTIRPPCQNQQIYSQPLNLIATRNQTGIQFYWQNILRNLNDTAGTVYQLHIEQLSNHSPILTVDLLPTITNYFLPIFKQDNQINDRYLNVTLTVYRQNQIEQQQTIIIELYQNNNRQIHLNMISSLAKRIQFNSFIVLIYLILMNFLR